MREDGRIVSGEGCKERVYEYNRRMEGASESARNRRILHTPVEWMNPAVYILNIHKCNFRQMLPFIIRFNYLFRLETDHLQVF
jgi:hypothetical protein